MESVFKRDSMNQILTDLLSEQCCAFLTLCMTAAVLCCVWITHCTAGRNNGDGQVSQSSIKLLVLLPLDLQKKFCYVPTFYTINQLQIVTCLVYNHRKVHSCQLPIARWLRSASPVLDGRIFHLARNVQFSLTVKAPSPSVTEWKLIFF